jgi:hypothetical protein
MEGVPLLQCAARQLLLFVRGYPTWNPCCAWCQNHRFSRAFSLLRVFAFVLRVFAYIYFCIHTFIMFNCFLNQNVEARNTAPNFNLQSSTAGAVAMVWFNDTPKVISRYIKEFYELQGWRLTDLLRVWARLSYAKSSHGEKTM